MSELGLDERSRVKVAEERQKLSSARMNIVVFMTLLIDLLGFTVILPLMPKLLEFYGKEGSVSCHHISTAFSYFTIVFFLVLNIGYIP